MRDCGEKQFVPSLCSAFALVERAVISSFHFATQNDSWDIRRRYNDFSQLHQRLGKFLEGEPNVILPPKRVWGNQSERVISQRRVQLQEYLVRVLEIFDPLNTSEHKQTNDSSPYNTLTAFLQLPAPPAI
mmetsp:Transcript_36221/g.56573  ORF Transcript_36221/g.56573 Transcript_36221/m.56573 type:complete len:130 (+) Transcript_36221:680-1069(+)